jgi:hypothetical protein
MAKLAQGSGLSDRSEELRVRSLWGVVRVVCQPYLSTLIPALRIPRSSARLWWRVN